MEAFPVTVVTPLRSLDLRGLPAPEPLIRALDAARRLQPGEALEVYTPLVPGPLLELLDEEGVHASVTRLDEGGACVRVHRPPLTPCD